MDKLVEMICDGTKYLCGLAKRELDYICRLEDNLEELQRKWTNLQAHKNDVETQIDQDMRGDRVNTWLQQTEGIQKEIEDIRVQGDQEIQNKCLCKCCPRNCISSYKLGKNVAKMVKNVDEQITTAKSFNIEIAHKVPLLRSIEFLMDEPVGLNSMLEKAWNSIETENVGIIGLYGLGGTGKTTLLKKINNEFHNRRLDFHIVLWVEVSKILSYDSIMDNIRKRVGIENNIWNNYSNNEKVAKINRVLKQKKFVLLMDDIWKKVDLNMVGVPHPKDTNFQSKVLFATRYEDVCNKMEAHRIFKVECLEENDAIDLFFKKVGKETLDKDPKIRKLARDMAIQCKGLPLVLTVMGIAMAGVMNWKVWEHSKNNLTSSSLTASNYQTKVLSILKFSYDQLPDEMHKHCFLYCALYPEDYQIQILNLIDKWIGERYLGKYARIQHMYNQSETVIEKLKLSCLLESVDFDSSVSNRIKMHDVVRDMALWLMRDQDKNKKKILVGEDVSAMPQDDVEIWRNVERISIKRNGELHGPRVECPNLISLMFELSNQQRPTCFPNIQYMSRLKVLDLSNTFDEKLLSKIGGLVLLEYLSLVGYMSASWFPIELKNLKNLKYFKLSVNGGDLASIPLEVISNLKQLKLLKFFTNAVAESGEETEFLEKLESLPKLEALWIKIHTGNGLKKLLESTKLQSCMWNLDLQDMDTPINLQSLLACMSRMKQLDRIWFFHLNIVEDSSISHTCYLSMLREVYISSCHSIVHLTWLKYAPHLEDLQIVGCKSLEEVIKGGTEDIESEDNIFSSLVRLDLKDHPNLKSIHKKALPFPSLKSVEIFGCPNLKKLPFDSNIHMDKFRRIRGGHIWWDNLEWENPTTKHKFHSKYIYDGRKW